jgi:hypothetical protein
MHRSRHRFLDESEEKIPVTRESMADYRRLLQYVRPYRTKMLVAISALTVGTFLRLLMPLHHSETW